MHPTTEIILSVSAVFGDTSGSSAQIVALFIAQQAFFPASASNGSNVIFSFPKSYVNFSIEHALACCSKRLLNCNDIWYNDLHLKLSVDYF